MDDSERLHFAQWVLERNLGWIAAAEVKTGVLVAICTAMLGALAAAFSALQPVERTIWANTMTALSAICLISAIYCAAVTVVPKLSGPKSSLIFFGRIAKQKPPDYYRSFREAKQNDLLDDCLAQIHRNAEIALDKMKWVRNGMLWAFTGILPWIAALASLVRV